ncbi:MAG TPA: hypothetical protein VF407_09700 [Polyangiaceae bacterium]
MNRRSALGLLFGVIAFAPTLAHAAAPAPDLLAKLAQHAAGFEQMKTHVSYSLAGTLQTIAASDAADSTKTMQARVTADGKRTHFSVVKYTEDGADKTDEARAKAAEHEKKKALEKPDAKKKRDLKMPFLKSEQSRYVFEQVETDATDPSRVRISFSPKESADDTVEGSAWVDTKSGTVISTGFKLSRLPSFVDYVHVTVEFGTPTAFGPAPSVVKVTGRGSFLFLSKRFRGEATFSDYALVK